MTQRMSRKERHTHSNEYGLIKKPTLPASKIEPIIIPPVEPKRPPPPKIEKSVFSGKVVDGSELAFFMASWFKR
jgi:hypothetical protein